MKVNITDKYILIINEDFSLIHFLTNIENQYSNFENNNLILDLTNNVDANKIDYKIFKEFAKKQKKHKKSLVLITSKIDLKKIPNYLNVVPTITEAIDIIELEEIERDLGF